MPLATARTDERRREDRDVGRDVGAGRDLDVLDRLLRLARRQVAPAGLAPELLVERAVLAALDERVHRAQAFERVLAVEHATVVDLAQVALHVGARQRRAAEDHRHRVGEPARVQLLEVLAHDDRRLHEQAAHADRVGLHLERLLDHLVDRDLDAEVVNDVAVVRQDDVDEVLADVVDVALHRGEHDHALAAGVGLLHERLEVRDRGLHRLGRLQHERQLHLAAAEQLADDLHAVEQHVVHDLERRAASSAAPARSASRPSRSPSMMRCFSRSDTGQPERSSFSIAPASTFSNSAMNSVSGS